MRTHRATLLHYVSANGVENYRQKTPKNAVEVAKILLDAGAEVDAEANMYGGRDKTLGLVATSIWPAKAGVLAALIKLLLDAGADVDGGERPGGAVNACLHNGRPEGAAILARHGASLDLEASAGVGRLDVVKSFFNEDGSLKPTATKAQMEAGLMWACEFGQANVVEFLLDRGLDPGTEVHGMGGLHWTMVGGHLDIINLLLARGAPLEAKNIYGGTALGAATWAVRHSDPVYRWPEVDTDWAEIIRTLLEAGADVYEADYPTGNEGVDELLRRHRAK
jgi:ankyrin repeat protein